MSKPASVKTFKVFRGRVLSGRGRAHGIMSRGCHCLWHLLRYFSKELHAVWASWKCSPCRIQCRYVFDISDAGLNEILSNTRTNQQLTSFFALRLQTYLEQMLEMDRRSCHGVNNPATTTRRLIHLLLK